MWRLQAISKAAKFPDGMNFNSYKEWADTLVGKHLIVTIGHREHNGNKYPEVKGFKESQAGAPQVGGPAITVGNDKVPF